MPDYWPYTKPEVTELLFKMLAEYERAPSGGLFRNGWMTTGDICAKMLERHAVRLDRSYVEGILAWGVTVGALEGVGIDDGFGRLPRWRVKPGVSPGHCVREAGVLGG